MAPAEPIDVIDAIIVGAGLSGPPAVHEVVGVPVDEEGREIEAT